jgi:hypothetical protein
MGEKMQERPKVIRLRFARSGWEYRWKGKSSSKGKSRFPAGMTTRKASATAKTDTGPSATLRFAQDDGIF